MIPRDAEFTLASESEFKGQRRYLFDQQLTDGMQALFGTGLVRAAYYLAATRYDALDTEAPDDAPTVDDLDTTSILIEFMNGRLVKVWNSEWGGLEAVEAVYPPPPLPSAPLHGPPPLDMSGFESCITEVRGGQLVVHAVGARQLVGAGQVPNPLPTMITGTIHMEASAFRALFDKAFEAPPEPDAP